jgi:ribosomal protein S1
MFVKEKQRERKRSDRVHRPLPLDNQRIPLSVLPPGMKCRGTCISVTSFGAYIDIGTECDGLLHVGQMYRVDEGDSKTFVQNPRQIVQPGDEITVTIRSVNPSRKKLHLTLLPWEIVEQQLEAEQVAKASDDDAHVAMTDRMTLSDMEIDDELWGEIRRVTDFGAYVEVGAVVDGFLHYMDHPSFSGGGQHPTEFMQRGDRIRIWVADVDRQRNRIKLTAQRPPHLPGPRRELSL